MTPKEKAKELFDKYWLGITPMLNQSIAKFCALIAVDEILSDLELDDRRNEDCSNLNSPRFRFWESVKQEINKL